MAEYKKKTVKKLRTEKASKPQKIEMTSSKKAPAMKKNTAVPSKGLKLITGRRPARRKSGLIFLAVSVLILSVYLIMSAFHPIGVIEYLSTAYKSIGSDSGYPLQLNGDDIISINEEANFYYILTSSELFCNNKNGKSVSKINHGFSKPSLKISETRALVYGQGEKFIKIYRFNDEVITEKFDYSVLTADICDNGSFAVATYADSYDSAVKVYNKKGECIYEWYSADGTVNALLLNERGNKLLVSTFTVENGTFNTKIRLLNFKSADPEQTYTVQNDILYNLYNITGTRACAVFENNLYYLNLKEGSSVNNQSDYSYKISDLNDGRLAMLSSLTANSDKNIIEVFDKKSVCIGKFSVDFPINDLVVSNNIVYILSNQRIVATDFSGNILKEASAAFDVKRIIPIDSSAVAAVSNSRIERIDLEEGVRQ